MKTFVLLLTLVYKRERKVYTVVLAQLTETFRMFEKSEPTKLFCNFQTNQTCWIKKVYPSKRV